MALRSTTQPTRPDSIGLDAAGPATFALDLSALPGGASPSADDPLVITPGQAVSFDVRFTPVAESPVTAEGPVLETTRVRVLSDAYTHERAVVVTGFGSDVLCPTALGGIAEGTVVPQGTVLHFSSGASFAAPGRSVAQSRWSVTHSMANSPPGAIGVFVPSLSFPNQTFAANLVGEYTFRLDVWDDQGLQTCVPWTSKVTVVTKQSFHVELIWRTPSDSDETDEGAEAGSDLDLHFAALDYTSGSKYGGDGDGKDDPWFGTYDTFWFTPAPNWGSFNPAVTDDPMMLRDDTDGGGPELIAAETLKPGQYGIAVHYFHDHGYGDAWAKVRVHVADNLVLETEEVRLTMGDLWNVATVQFPALTVAPLETPEGAPVIYSNYSNPMFSP